MRIDRGCGLIFVITLSLFPLNPLSAEEDFSIDLEPVIVSKTRLSLLKHHSLGYDCIKNLAFNSPIEALGILPLDLQPRSPLGAIQTDFSLRGSTFQGVAILIDGQRINDPQTGHHNSDIPVTSEDIEKIEVMPGASSSLAGPDAIGGAVNILLKKNKDKRTVLEFSGGQYQTQSGLFSISDKINDLGVRFSLENQESGGFYEDTDFKKFTTTLNPSWDFADGTFDMSLGYQEKEFGAYDFYTPGSGYLSKEWTKTYLFITGLNLDKDGFIIRPNFLWRRHYDKFMLDKTMVRSRYLNHHRSDVFTPNIYLQREYNSLGKVGLGLEYSQEIISSTNLGKHRRSHRSIFMDEAKDLNSNLSAGLSLRLDDFDGFNRVYSGSLNSRYKIFPDSFAHLGLSRSMRVPSFTELYYNDPTTLGNADLSAEGSLGYELGYGYKRENLSWGLTFFFRQEKDLIDWVKRSVAQAKWQVENIAQARILGSEADLQLEITRNFSIDLNYTYVDKRVDDDGFLYKYGQNYTRHLFNSTLAYELPFGMQTLGLAYKKKPARDGWLLLSTCFSYKINKNANLFLKASNLLGIEYQEIEGIPQPGRTVYGGVRLAW